MPFDAASLRAFERTLRVQVDRTLPDMARKSLADAARATVVRVHQEQRARSGGIQPDHVQIVDGIRGASFDQVRPDGQIILDWNYLTEAVIRTVEYLRLHGPELKGEWKDSILVEVDGAIVPPSRPIPPTAKRAMVGVNTPYSRRLEIGTRKDGRPFVVQVPQHFVESAALQLRRQLREIAEVRFRMASFLGPNQRVTRKELRDSRVPAIELTEVQAL